MSGDRPPLDDQAISAAEALDEELAADELARLLPNQMRGHRLLSMREEIGLAREIATGRSAEDRLQAEPALPLTERRALRRQAETGARARQELARHNVRLAYSIAQRYVGPNFSLEDAQQESLIGLLRAVDRFDPARGYRFSSFATWWIRDSVRRARLDQSRAVRLPEQAREDIRRLDRIEHDLAQHLERLPTTDEMAALLDRPVDEVERLLLARQEPISLEATTDEEEEIPLIERLADNAPEPSEQAIAGDLRDRIRALLDRLPERERAVLIRRFDLDGKGERTLAEVGQELGASRDRVRQIERQALRRLADLAADDQGLPRS